MVLKEECTKIGDSYYLNTDIQAMFDKRFNKVVPEDL